MMSVNWYSVTTLSNWAFPATLVLILAHSSQAQYDNTRCKCICPDPQVVNNATDPTGNSSSTNRTLYISNTVPANLCTCDKVVLPHVTQEKFPFFKGKEGEFCPRCECKYESRNLGIIKVVVIIVIWVVSLLMIYMLFLMCLDPLLNKRIKSTAYQEHTNEDDDSVGGSRTSHPMRVTGGSVPSTIVMASSLGPSSSVLNRVGHQQSKWKRQVQEQRKNIYTHHTMLN